MFKRFSIEIFLLLLNVTLIGYIITGVSLIFNLGVPMELFFIMFIVVTILFLYAMWLGSRIDGGGDDK